jgi:hypothetical protein
MGWGGRAAQEGGVAERGKKKKGKLGFFVVFPFSYFMFLSYFLLTQIEFLIKRILHKLTHQTK